MGDVLESKDDRGAIQELAVDLELVQVMDRDVENLSGGELQRFAIAVVAAQNADVYMIDEPSSYLDVRQRLKAARVSAHRPLHRLAWPAAPVGRHAQPFLEAWLTAAACGLCSHSLTRSGILRSLCFHVSTSSETALWQLLGCAGPRHC